MSCDVPITPNTDFSGIGVRVSFYAQATFLSLLSARSVSSNETGNALATLVITNLAYGVTTLLLGFKDQPELSLYDGLVVIYLLTLSWFAIQFSLPQYNRFHHSDPFIKLLAILQSYLVLGAALAIGIAAPAFGNTPRTCNRAVSAVVFVAFPFHRGRVPLLVGLSAVAVGYTVLIVYDYRRGVEGGYSPTAAAPPVDGYGSGGGPVVPVGGGVHPDGGLVSYTHLGYASHRGALRHVHVATVTVPEPRTRTRTRLSLRPLTMAFPPRDTVPSLRPSSRINGRIVVTVFLMVLFSTVTIANTELLILHNRPIITSVDWNWTFGQILPLFLAFWSGSSCIKVFVAYGCGPRPRHLEVDG